MNYLAHLYLSENTLESRLGNFLGDFAKGEERTRLDPALQAGIARHQRIDSFTDAHPQVKISRKRIDPRYRYLAGVMVDVFYDHFLAIHWREYSERSLEDFASEIYRSFLEYRGYLPSSARFVIRHMAAEHRLESYRNHDEIEATFRRIAYRLRRPEMLDGAADQLLANYDGLDADFRLFFPDLREHIQPA